MKSTIRPSMESALFLLLATSSCTTVTALSTQQPPPSSRCVDSSSFFEFPPRWSPIPIRRKDTEETITSPFGGLKELKPRSVSGNGVSSMITLPVPKSSAKTQTYDPNPVSPRTEEQARMQEMVLGAVVGIGVLYALAAEGSPKLEVTLLDSVKMASSNIVETAVPSTTYDIMAVALGETLAGLTGAVASLGFNLLMMNTRKAMAKRTSQAQSVINQAVAESDYFFARAAVLPLLEGAGLSPGIATLASSLFATLPYELVKVGNRQRTARKQENEMLQEMLKRQLASEENARRIQRQARWNMDSILKQARGETSIKTKETNNNPRTTVDPSTLQPIQTEEIAIDGVELFADTCKWLSYSVLMQNFSGTLAWNGMLLGGGIESGFYGLLATLTSQIYADFLYIKAEAGPTAKREQVKAREASEWIQLYLSKSISAITLFGVYTSVQVPVKVAINALLSGSIDSCLGSADVDMCIETYYTQNPPGADFGAQMRAVATTVYSFSQILNVDFEAFNQASADAQMRAIVTTLVSLSHRLM